MRVRHIIAGILVTFGIMFLLGAVGNGDFYGFMTATDFVNIGVGAGMITAAAPVGNVKDGEQE